MLIVLDGGSDGLLLRSAYENSAYSEALGARIHFTAHCVTMWSCFAMAYYCTVSLSLFALHINIGLFVFTTPYLFVCVLASEKLKMTTGFCPTIPKCPEPRTTA